MTLSTKSWYHWVYKMTYGWSSAPPNNLCPYFWKLVVAFILFIPFFVFNLITFTIDLFDERDYHREGFFTNFAKTFVVNFVAGLLYGMVAVWFTGWEGGQPLSRDPFEIFDEQISIMQNLPERVDLNEEISDLKEAINNKIKDHE